MLVSPKQPERRHRQPSSRPQALQIRLLPLVTLMVALTFAVVSFLSTSANVKTLRFDVDPSESSREFPLQGKRAPLPSSLPSSFTNTDAAPPPPRTETVVNKAEIESGPFHNWQLFSQDFLEMTRSFKIYVYPDAFMNQSRSKSSQFSHIFLPHPNASQPRLGNYYSEHMFKVALLRSSLITPNPEKAHLFFLPFSINLMRNDPRIHSEESISQFITQYINRIRRDFPFWNASAGADHFYVYCHSVGRDAASKFHDLRNNAIQVTCSSSYFQRFYVSHKDLGLPQVWPRPLEEALTPPNARHKLVYFSGRIQNSRIRKELMDLWRNDSSMDIFSGSPPFPYVEGFKRSKYCLHVKGYEVNTARVSDAIHYGCIPVIISNYYDLPFANVLNWSKLSVIISHKEIRLLKQKLLSVSPERYLDMFRNLCQVRQHFRWHETPRGLDSFYMTAYQLWLRRDTLRQPQ